MHCQEYRSPSGGRASDCRWRSFTAGDDVFCNGRKAAFCLKAAAKCAPAERWEGWYSVSSIYFRLVGLPLFAFLRETVCSENALLEVNKNNKVLCNEFHTFYICIDHLSKEKLFKRLQIIFHNVLYDRQKIIVQR